MEVQPEWFKLAVKLDDDHYTAKPGEVLIPLVRAVQELSAQITDLQAEVALLKSGASASAPQ